MAGSDRHPGGHADRTREIGGFAREDLAGVPADTEEFASLVGVISLAEPVENVKLWLNLDQTVGDSRRWLRTAVASPQGQHLETVRNYNFDAYLSDA